MENVKARGAFLFNQRTTLSAMHALATYLRHVREEFTHIVWPTTRTAVAHTLVVVLIALAMTVIVGISDYGFSTVLSRVIGA